MSQESVEVTRRGFDAYNRRDLRALREIYAPDVVLDWTASRWLGAGVYRGNDAAVRFCADYFDAFEEIILEPDCFMDAGDSVVVPNIARVRGRDGIQVVARSTLAFTVRGGRTIRICLYQETRHALEAAGVSVAGA